MICIAEPLDVLAHDLGAVADRVSVILPWGSLLRAVARPEIGALRQIASLCLSGAGIEIVFSYDSARDAREAGLLGATQLSVEHIHEVLTPVYQEAGIPIMTAECISPQELAAYETTWAKRLANGRPREIWRIRASYSGS